MGVRKDRLPKNIGEKIAAAAESGDWSPMHAALQARAPDARGGFSNGTVLMLPGCTPELARWALARGLDVNARDDRGETVLHRNASRYRALLPVALLLELGADPSVASKTGHTPLHVAAGAHVPPAVRALLAAGVDAHAVTARGESALDYALQRVTNATMVRMLEVAELLVPAGLAPSDASRDRLFQATETFEFHRESINADLVGAASNAMLALCEMFGVTPAPRRQMHDGKAEIRVEGPWRERHAKLWEQLVPSRGPAATVQGEVVRISGRIGSELFRNGGMNWDRDYDAMGRALCEHLSSGTPLHPRSLRECLQIVETVLEDQDRSARLAELAVEWVALNPTPMPLAPPTTYKR